MANKEATVYIIDVGKSMGRRRLGENNMSTLDWAMQYFWDNITTTVMSGRKTANVGVIALRSDDTHNSEDEDEGYQHINVLKEIGQVLMPDLRMLGERIKASQTNDGDDISAIAVAIQMIERYTRTLKYKRKIVLISSGDGAIDPEDIGEIVTRLKQQRISLVVLGVDFDDEEFGYKEPFKQPRKAMNENILKSVTQACENLGAFGTIAEAIFELATPRVKEVKPVTSFKGKLTIGNPQKYPESAVSIAVERYPRTKIARPPTASSFVLRSDENTESTTMVAADEGGDIVMSKARFDSDALTPLYMARTYQVDDPMAPGGKRDVEKDDLAKGYEYGRTAVYISQTDENITKLETQPGLDIIGFISQSGFEHHMKMGEASIIVPFNASSDASIELTAFVHCLYELGTYAIGRLVRKVNAAPQILLLAPEITAEHSCLIDVELPFTEDCRLYRFPPLDKIVTVSGKEIQQHRNLPSSELQTAMDNFVKAMDLATAEIGKTELAAIENTFSPVLHRIQAAIRHRAIHPQAKIPPTADILLQYSQPPRHLMMQHEEVISTLIEKAGVKLVPQQKRASNRSHRSIDKPLSGLDIGVLLSLDGGSSSTAKSKQGDEVKIDTSNPIPSYKQILSLTTSVAAITSATASLQSLIESQIQSSLGNQKYDMVIEEMGVMRENLLDLEEPQLWNDWLERLKTKLDQDELGEGRGELWWRVRRGKLGLIERKEDEKIMEDEEIMEMIATDENPLEYLWDS